ncbi:hypothetical protein P7K49_040801 [Saguinus oedipus]|uniref:Uncharacterized protein n=1 Tax=Saguinus oedipus TaxID=9490 RepID=A0ABQ9TAP2_SAGOE|nr:hypothetical protein P7K49_040801 [Saguinus oedipus]
MGKNHDECVIALHDCNGDVNRAINSQARRMVARWNTTQKAKKIETGTETIVRDMVGHQDGGEVPAMDESVCMGLYSNPSVVQGQENGTKSGGPSGRGTERGRRCHGQGKGGSGR